MNATELIRAGRLTEARAELVQGVKNTPADREVRGLLFKVLAFMGEWDKAALHLDILAGQSKSLDLTTYQELIAAERRREEVRLHKGVPEFLTEAPGYLSDFLEARRELGEGRSDRLTALLSVLEEALGGLAGSGPGGAFLGVADVDPTLMPFLEVIIHDRYLWFPFHALRELSVQPPATLLDLLWCRARIVTWDGLTSDCVLPASYPGTWAHGNDLLRLGRGTEWASAAGGFSRGIGQHLFLIGEDVKGIFELGELQFQFRSMGQPK